MVDKILSSSGRDIIVHNSRFYLINLLFVSYVGDDVKFIVSIITLESTAHLNFRHATSVVYAVRQHDIAILCDKSFTFNLLNQAYVISKVKETMLHINGTNSIERYHSTNLSRSFSSFKFTPISHKISPWSILSIPWKNLLFSGNMYKIVWTVLV